MKPVLILLLSVLFSQAIFFQAACPAETLYVDDQNSVTIHTGPDPQNRIVAVVGSGQTLEALARQGAWTKVRLPPDKEGWAISRYLTDREPRSLLYEGAEKALAAEKAKVLVLERKIQALTQTGEAMGKSLLDAQEQAARVKAAYEALSRDSGQALLLRKDLEKTRADLARARQESYACGKLLEEARSSSPLKWFLAGAGVIAAGLILGIILKSRQRRSRF